LGNDGLDEAQKAARRELHETLDKALKDFQRYQFNTVVSACMILLNLIGKRPVTTEANVDARITQEAFAVLLPLLSPIAPHMTLYLWRALGYGDDILKAAWPVVDETALVRDTIELVVQVNGKVRGRISVAANSSQEEAGSAALAESNVMRFLEGKDVKKVIVVPGKLVSIVAK
jgi:leucyl-tRNA synthetase